VTDLRPIAFYLPQYHPTPENDAFWGPGFTEWRNVVRARPRFPGHAQPHLPADLGFYDLRLPEVRAAQADLARAAGIHGFCYYHYWFGGRRLLHRPLDAVLASGEPDFPFMLAWANENWTRAWDGGPREVMLAQTYSDADAEAHIEHLLPILADPRYIRIDGRPVFAIYNADEIPEPRRLTDIFRERALRAGIRLYLARIERHLDRDTRPPEALGFDAAIEFQPFSRSFRRFLGARPDLRGSLSRRVSHRLGREVRARPALRAMAGRWTSLDTFHDYAAFAAFDAAEPPPPYTMFPGVCPGWDNTARRPPGQAIVFRGSTPELFGRWLAAKAARFAPPSPEENLLFVNAWNEWAEGNHLEPCLRHGHAHLEAMAQALGHRGAHLYSMSPTVRFLNRASL
jgi:lipopolysaccharide biosynthesis protein